MGQDDFDADAICAAVERMDGQMTALALNELPKDDYYGGDDGIENLDEEQGETAAKEAPGDKKQRSWLGKVGKGLYRRASNLARGSATSQEDEDLRAAIFACRHPKAAATGGVGCTEIEHQKICRSVLSLMISQMGRNLLTGGNVMNVSFPIQCCQPRTILEIGSLMGGFCHHFLPRASAAKDPMERMKQVVACFVATTILTSGNFLKPLNPILGETLQAELAGGTQLWMEQVCHHPPISAFYLKSGAGDYEVSGHQTFTIGFGYNKMLIRNKGVRTVHFPDGGCIAIDFPGDKFTNVFFGGDMIHETTDSQTYTDEENNLRCRLAFGNPSGRRGIPSDWFEGVIERYDPAAPEVEGTVVSQVEGSWVGFIDFDEVRYWDYRSCDKAPICAPANVLPSDSRNRADRNALAAKDIKVAQAHKTRLEQQQRAERKLREAAGYGH